MIYPPPFISPDSVDPVVISKAQELNAVLISLNSDFADIVTYPPSKYNGIIALQVKNHPEVIPHLMARLKNYFLNYPDIIPVSQFSSHPPEK